MKQRSILLFLIMGTMVLWGCGSNGSTNSGVAGTSSEQEFDTTLAYPLEMAIPSLDPHLSLTGSSTRIGMNIYEGLFAFNSSYEPIPMLAESYELSEDGKQYTFHLREGVLFHNGKEMKAEDVTTSLNRWKSVAPRAQTAFGDTEFTVKDEYTVELKFDEPKNDTLAQLSHVLNFAAIMPKEVVEAASADGIDEYIGTGPFKFVEWKMDQYVHVQKFDEYQSIDAEADGYSGKKEALLEDIYFTLATDNSTRFSLFLAKDFHYVDLNVDHISQVENDPEVAIEKSLSSDLNLVFNKKSPLFSNITYRQAVAALLNVEDILLGTVSDPSLYRLNSSYMYKENKNWYSEAGAEIYNQNDPEKAKALLKEAGYNGEVVRLLTSKEMGTFYSATLVVQQQLEQIGVNTKVEIYDFTTLLTKRADPDAWDIYVGEFTTPTTPSQLLYLNASYGFADDAKLAELLKKVNASIDPVEIKNANDELQAYVWEYLPVVKIGDMYEYSAIRKNLEGLTLYSGYPNLANTQVLK